MQIRSLTCGPHAGALLLSGLLFLLPGMAPAAPSETPAAAPAITPSPALQLHVPSPDWRDQVIYFLMLDRFDDGNSGNNDQGHGEFDPGNNAKYSGGDLAGVQRRLDYIKGLGATAVWLTPPVANQWWDGSRGYGGYHGYWAENFKAVDAHNGSLADYQRLSDALHRSGLYLIQDVVVNHTGNFFDYRNPPTADAGAARYTGNVSSVPVAAPSQYPFSLNDARQPTHRDAAIYHWTPEIQDFTDHQQETTYQLAGLDDLNTDNPTVRTALRDSYNHWIREVGVDAFRVDTAFHVEPGFFEDFLYSNDSSVPGVMKTAEQTGRQQFHVFGEGFGVAPAFDDKQARKVDSYMRSADGRPRLPGMINFPLYGSINDVFARGKPTAELAHRIRSTMTLHANPQLMPSFVDNHDVDRFLAGGNEAGLKQALLLIMTLPGIPTLYYGTEQGFREQRASMFAAGYGAGGRDHFNTQAELYRYIQQLTRLRREHRLFSRGTPTLLADNPAAAGALAYRMDHEGNSALVLFNSSSKATLLANMATGLPAGTVLTGLFGINGTPEHLVVAHDGSISLPLPAFSGGVWRVSGERQKIQPAPHTIVLDKLSQAPYRDDFSVSGQARGLREFTLVIDGDLATAQTIVADANGNWRSEVRTDSLIQPALQHSLVAWSEAHQIVSTVQHFRTERQWTLLSQQRDPAADDHGRNGRYRYPTHPSWNQHRPLDIDQISIASSGGSLQIELTMHTLMASWNPPNGFDHLAITAFIELPNQPAGSREMPLQNSQLPSDMRWHYRLRLNGWSNTLFSHHGSSASNEGTAIGSATLQVDRQHNRIRIQLPANLLADTRQLRGAKLYLTSWDYDGGYKPLAPEPSAHGFGGDKPEAALVMDETAIIVLP